tara:strand:- start:769 stop:1695 length:927 start_codon:yes stop_codon:yes gene_type:complete
MAKFNLDNYETVEERLKKFWKDYPNGRVETEVVHITEDGTCVTIKSAIYKDMNDTHPVATGIAQETKGQGGFANADAWMENCETSSLGRSLSNWMYQGANKPRPSKEEMSKVQVEKKPVKKTTKQEQAAMDKVVEEMVSPSEEEVAKTDDTQEMIKEGKFTDVGKQLNQLLEAMIPDESLRQTIKGNAYNELVNNGLADKDIKSWTKENMDVFMTRAEDMFSAMGIDNEIAQTTEKEIVEEVFGEVSASVVKTCPECNSPDWIEDNREKKASDERFAKIPSWSCSTYQSNNGCGWTAWGDTDCPKEWL